MATELIDDGLLDLLRCPASGQRLQIDGDGLITIDGSRRYGLIDGIPLLILESAEPTHDGYKAILADNRDKALGISTFGEKEAECFLNGMLVPTCGNLFHGVRLAGRYPIPEFPHFANATAVLDVGCNWGRWSIAGAKAGYRIVGVDVHLESLFCARYLSRKLVPNNMPHFVLADARHLPFAPESFSGVFSYSVIQHFSKSNAANILGQINHVMMHGANSIIQMPNKTGLRAILSGRVSRNSETTDFDVRYYSLNELIALFEKIIGKSNWYVDCFLGLNVHSRDRDLVPISKRWIVDAAALLLRASQISQTLRKLADSVFVSSTKN